MRDLGGLLGVGDSAIFGIDLLGGGADLDDFGAAFQVEREVNAETLTRGKLDGDLRGLLESLLGGGQLIAARLEIFHSVGAVIAADRFAIGVFIETMHRHRRVGQGKSARIACDAADIPERRLPVQCLQLETGGQKCCK